MTVTFDKNLFKINPLKAKISLPQPCSRLINPPTLTTAVNNNQMLTFCISKCILILNSKTEVWKKCTLTIFNSCKTHYSSLSHTDAALPQRFCCMIAIYQRAKLRHLKNQFEYFFSAASLSLSLPIVIPARIFAIHSGCSFEGNRIWIVTFFFNGLCSEGNRNIATEYCDWIEVVLRREWICWWMRWGRKVEKDFVVSLTTMDELLKFT